MKLSIKLKRKALHKALDEMLDAADVLQSTPQVSDIHHFRNTQEKLLNLLREYERPKP